MAPTSSLEGRRASRLSVREFDEILSLKSVGSNRGGNENLQQQQQQAKPPRTPRKMSSFGGAANNNNGSFVENNNSNSKMNMINEKRASTAGAVMMTSSGGSPLFNRIRSTSNFFGNQPPAAATASPPVLSTPRNNNGNNTSSSSMDENNTPKDNNNNVSSLRQQFSSTPVRISPRRPFTAPASRTSPRASLKKVPAGMNASELTELVAKERKAFQAALTSSRPAGSLSELMQERYMRLPLDSEVEKKRISRILREDQKKRSKILRQSEVAFTNDDPMRVERAVLACFRAAGRRVAVHPFVSQPGTQDWLPGQEDGMPPAELTEMSKEASKRAMELAPERSAKNSNNNLTITDITNNNNNNNTSSLSSSSAATTATPNKKQGLHPPPSPPPSQQPQQPAQHPHINIPNDLRTEWNLNFAADPPYIEKEGFRISSKGISAVPSFVSPLACDMVFSALDIDADEFMPGVWAAFDDENNRWCAVRKFLVTREEDRTHFVDELTALHELPSKDPRTSPLPLLLGCYLNRLEVRLVYEFPDAGNADLLIKSAAGPMPEKIASCVLRMMLVALSKLHAAGRVHNAISPKNLWLFATGQVKLAGLEYSSYVEKRASNGVAGVLKKYHGPHQSMAPERLLGLESTPLSDIWSVGLTAMELVTASFPYGADGANVQEFKWRVVHGPIPMLDAKKYSSKLIDFCMFCLKKNPQYRLGVQGLLQHPFIVQHEDVGRRDVRQWCSA